MLAVLTVRDLHAIEKIHVSKEEISPFGRNDNLIRDSLNEFIQRMITKVNLRVEFVSVKHSPPGFQQ